MLSISGPKELCLDGESIVGELTRADTYEVTVSANDEEFEVETSFSILVNDADVVITPPPTAASGGSFSMVTLSMLFVFIFYRRVLALIWLYSLRQICHKRPYAIARCYYLALRT